MKTTVAQFGSEVVDFVIGIEIGQPPVKRQPHREVRNEFLRDQHRHTNGDLRRPAVRRWFGNAGLQVEDRLLQHRLIKLEADFLDVSRLLLAKQIAGAADIQIVRG